MTCEELFPLEALLHTRYDRKVISAVTMMPIRVVLSELDCSAVVVFSDECKHKSMQAISRGECLLGWCMEVVSIDSVPIRGDY